MKATRAGVVMAGGQIAQTFFFSTSGGRTATNEEAFGGTPISYLRSVDDPHDDLSPYHDWTARFTAGDARKRLRSVTLGTLQSLRVATPHAVRPRRDRARARQRRRSDRVGRDRPHAARAPQHLDLADQRSVERQLRLGRGRGSRRSSARRVAPFTLAL